jgi:hypothetical protein
VEVMFARPQMVNPEFFSQYADQRSRDKRPEPADTIEVGSGTS